MIQSGHLSGLPRKIAGAREGDKMKTAFVFYSYTGKTRALAEKRAGKEQAELIEIKEKKRRSTVAAYVLGSLAARRQKRAEIEPVAADFADYDKIVVAVPLWAGFPAPAFNSILELLPRGAKVELIITSGSGNSTGSREKTMALAASKGVQIVSYEDVKTAE